MTTGEAIQDITAGTFANGPAWRGAADEACRGERFACIGKQLDLSRPSSTSVGGLGDQEAGSHRPTGRAAHGGASVAESPGLKSFLSHRRIYQSHLVQERPLLASLPIFHQ